MISTHLLFIELLQMNINQLQWLIPLIVLFVSFFLSMFGLGGAQLYVPIFYFLGLNLKTEVIPLALLLNFVSQLSAATIYFKNKLIDIYAGAPLMVTAIIFSFIGAYFTRRVSSQLIVVLISLLLIIIAIQKLLSWQPTKKKLSKSKKFFIGLIAGSLIGFIIGLLGHGGGSFVVPTLLFLGFPAKISVGTSSFVSSFSAMAGFLAHLKHSTLYLNMVVFGIIAAITGAQLGSRFMVKKISERKLNLLFGILLLLIGAQLLVVEFLF